MPPIDRDQLGAQFETYYERYKYVVFNRVRRRLSRYGNPLKQGADDLFQNIFINAFRWMNNYCNEYHQIPPEVIFEKALRKIEATKWVDYFRSRLKHIEKETGIEVFTAYEEEHAGGVSSLEKSAHQADPYDALRLSEIKSQLDRCLERLRAQESSAILCKALGHSDGEVSAFIGESVKKVTHSIIPLARKKLRKCLEAHL